MAYHACNLIENLVSNQDLWRYRQDENNHKEVALFNECADQRVGVVGPRCGNDAFVVMSEINLSNSPVGSARTRLMSSSISCSKAVGCAMDVPVKAR